MPVEVHSPFEALAKLPPRVAGLIGGTLVVLGIVLPAIAARVFSGPGLASRLTILGFFLMVCLPALAAGTLLLYRVFLTKR